MSHIISNSNNNISNNNNNNNNYNSRSNNKSLKQITCQFCNVPVLEIEYIIHIDLCSTIETINKNNINNSNYTNICNISNNNSNNNNDNSNKKRNRINFENNNSNNNNKNNNNINNNNSNSNSSSNNKIDLYNSVWNNIYLKRIILNYLKIFNTLNLNLDFYSIGEWKQFRYKEFLARVTMHFEYDIDLLPNSIEYIRFDIKSPPSTTTTTTTTTTSAVVVAPYNQIAIGSVSRKVYSIRVVYENGVKYYLNETKKAKAHLHPIISKYRNVFNNCRTHGRAGTLQSISIRDIKSGKVADCRCEWVLLNAILDNEILASNELPSSLTYLEISNYNQEIGINVLPANLKTLVFGRNYTRAINPLSIPQNLELLDIRSLHYSHLINLPNHPYTLVVCNNMNLYYQRNTSHPERVRSLRLPHEFKFNSLSSLRLQDKSNLEYLHLGTNFNGQILLEDLPFNNNIKILETSDKFANVINLEYFQKLETLIINNTNSVFKRYYYYNNINHPSNQSYPTLISSKHINNDNLNMFNLKRIIVPNKIDILKSLDSEFYPLLQSQKINLYNNNK